MTRALHKLAPLKVERLSKPGRHSDGGGLYLRIWPDGRRYWVFMYERDGKSREIGIGPAGKGNVSIIEARESAARNRAVLRAGGDPLAVKRATHAASTTDKPIPTFGTFADEYIETMRPSWRNAKHADQWTMTVNRYAAPIRQRPINVVDTDDVLKVLKPIWLSVHETARRLRGRLESILDAAKARGLRSGENPARWRGHLKNLLPRSQAERGHFPALPYVEIPGFMAALRERREPTARALEFSILTAVRPMEAGKARVAEVDLVGNVWTIPASRMKGKREHRVPLSPRAVQLLRDALRDQGQEFVFPGRTGHGLSENAAAAVLNRMGYPHVTVHGFRSTFRDWASEKTDTSPEVAEMALAHKIKDKTEAAYRRGELLEKRRVLMDRWAEFCASDASNVVDLAQRRAVA